METNNKPDIIKFLCGESDYNGLWFGGQTATGAPFWWRKILREEIQERDAKIMSLESSLLDITRQSCAKIAELEKEITMRNEYYENKLEATQRIINSNHTDWQRINSENQALKSELDKAKELLKAVDTDYCDWDNLCKITDFLKDKR